jgi:hypothetical protein
MIISCINRMALWSQSLYIVIPIVIIIIGHWVLILKGCSFSRHPHSHQLRLILSCLFFLYRYLAQSCLDPRSRLCDYRDQRDHPRRHIHLLHVFRPHHPCPYFCQAAKARRTEFSVNEDAIQRWSHLFPHCVSVQLFYIRRLVHSFIPAEIGSYQI